MMALGDSMSYRQAGSPSDYWSFAGRLHCALAADDGRDGNLTAVKRCFMLQIICSVVT